MATYEMCEICYDDKLVIKCGAGGVCDKKVCMKCRSRFRSFNCAFCFKRESKLEIVFEMEDRFNWCVGQGKPKIDAYIDRFRMWEYNCSKDSDCKCPRCYDPDSIPVTEEMINELIN